MSSAPTREYGDRTSESDRNKSRRLAARAKMTLSRAQNILNDIRDFTTVTLFYVILGRRSFECFKLSIESVTGMALLLCRKLIPEKFNKSVFASGCFKCFTVRRYALGISWICKGGGGGGGEKEGERKDKKRPTVVGSLFPEGAVIKCFVIPPNSKIGKEKCEKNDLLDTYRACSTSGNETELS